MRHSLVYRFILFTLLFYCSLSVSSLLSAVQTIDTNQPSEFQANAYAVVIGISQYREEAIPKVAYAVNDAEAVAKLLETDAGVPKSHMRVMTDAKATGNDLRSIGEWLRMRVKPESTVYVYYAGHGTPDPKTGDAYLVPWDGHPDFPQGLYPLKDLYAALNALPSNNIIVFLDSCFSGAAGRSVLAKGARPMVLSQENPILPTGKVIVLASASGEQIASEYDKVKQGLFTYGLLMSLQGEADSDHDGTITLKELYSYLSSRVARIALDELNREQTPVLSPTLESLGQRASLSLWRLHQPGKPGPRRKSKELLRVLDLAGLGEQAKADEFPSSPSDIRKLRGSVLKVVEDGVPELVDI